ncbi:MAG: hypothetical protein G8D61_01955 [gamma proteobacterium symbiont of Ctena orbiculata]
MTKTESEFIPAYLSLHKRGELSAHAETALARLEACDLCARYCRVNRRQTVKGVVCRTGEQAVVHSFDPHHGEEDPLRDWPGAMA